MKFPALFSTCLARSKEREISKPGKNRGLESGSNIIFSLIVRAFKVCGALSLQSLDARPLSLETRAGQLSMLLGVVSEDFKYILRFLSSWT